MDVRKAVSEGLNNVAEMIKRMEGKQNPTRVWEEIKEAMMNTAKNEIGYRARDRKQNWITDKILSLMDRRRIYENHMNQYSYNEIQKQIRAKIRIAKNI